MERQIFISSAIWHEIRPKINYKPIQEVLLDVALNNFGDILGINIFFICLEKLNEEDKNSIKFDSERKHINITIVLDYDAIQIMNQDQIHDYLIVKILKSLKDINISDIHFETDKFVETIEALLMLEQST